MDKIDYRKMNKELYAPKTEPSLIKVPAMNFIMVDGHGNPNDTEGEYNKAVEILYAFTFTIKMGRKFGTIGSKETELIDYHVPPLEGQWWMQDDNSTNFTNKEKYCWTSMIRQPDFITNEDFEQAKFQIARKKPELDITKARFERFEEGLCVQCMHIGPFDNEPATVAKIDRFIQANGLINDIGSNFDEGILRRHHEIYLNDPRKINPAKMKTILRHPVREN